MILFKNCRLIPELTEGYEGEYADVLVNDQYIIEKIAPMGQICEADVKNIIDVEGNTLLPGFFELHTHLCLEDLDFREMKERPAAEQSLEVMNYAREYLKQGYTTIRDAGCPNNLVVALRRAAQKGYVNVPDLISSGQIITPTESGNETFGDMYVTADSPYEVRKACRHQYELGNDITKYMATGAYLNESGSPGESIVMEDELKEAVKVADMKGGYVMAHAHGAEGIKLAINCGVRTIEHGSFIDDECIEMLKDSEKTFLVPTAAIGLACLEDDGGTLSEDMMDKSKKYELMEKACVNKAYAAGLKMGFGSDIDKKNFIANPGLEFYARTEWFDFKYVDILLQATKYSAEIAGLDHCKGTIKEGKNAELVVVDGNPDEDIYVMKKMPKYVYFQGELIEN